MGSPDGLRPSASMRRRESHSTESSFRPNTHPFPVILELAGSCCVKRSSGYRALSFRMPKGSLEPGNSFHQEFEGSARTISSPSGSVPNATAVRSSRTKLGILFRTTTLSIATLPSRATPHAVPRYPQHPAVSSSVVIPLRFAVKPEAMFTRLWPHCPSLAIAFLPIAVEWPLRQSERNARAGQMWPSPSSWPSMSLSARHPIKRHCSNQLSCAYAKPAALPGFAFARFVTRV